MNRLAAALPLLLATACADPPDAQRESRDLRQEVSQEQGAAGTDGGLTPTSPQPTFTDRIGTALPRPEPEDVRAGFRLTRENCAAGAECDGATDRVRTAGIGGFYEEPARYYANAMVAESTEAVAPPSSESGREAHQEAVVMLFIKAGLPAEQVAGAATGLTVKAAATREEPTPKNYELVSYTTKIQRAVEGIPVPNSVAIGRINGEGEVVWQLSFWPPIAKTAVAEAVELRAMAAGAEVDLLLAKGARIADTSKAAARVVLFHPPAISSEESTHTFPHAVAAIELSEDNGDGVRYYSREGEQLWSAQ